MQKASRRKRARGILLPSGTKGHIVIDMVQIETWAAANERSSGTVHSVGINGSVHGRAESYMALFPPVLIVIFRPRYSVYVPPIFSLCPVL